MIRIHISAHHFGRLVEATMTALRAGQDEERRVPLVSTPNLRSAMVAVREMLEKLSGPDYEVVIEGWTEPQQIEPPPEGIPGEGEI